MSKLTAQQILKIIEENYSESSFAHNDWTDTDNVEVPSEVGKREQEEKDAFWDSIEKEMEPLNYTEIQNHPKYKQYQAMPGSYETKAKWVLDYLGLGEVEEVAQYGGEDMGTTWYSVKYFKNHDVYIRIDGHYTSYNGTDFYDGYGKEVVPTERVVTFFE